MTVAADGSTLRPDMVIRMPAGRSVLVDAKAPLSAYLDAAEAADEATRAARLRDHATQVKQHIGQLARKAYWERFDESPEFIVMYLPNDALFEAAQQQDPALLEWALSQNVVIATPATLFALLLTVAHGWKQQKVELNAREIASLGRELHKRISDAAAHLAKLGRQIEGTVRAYNDTVGSLERRALPAARRFEHLHASHTDVEIEPLAQLENVPRAPMAPELSATVASATRLVGPNRFGISRGSLTLRTFARMFTRLDSGVSCTIAFFQAGRTPLKAPRRFGFAFIAMMFTFDTSTPKSSSTAWRICVLCASGWTRKLYLRSPIIAYDFSDTIGACKTWLTCISRSPHPSSEAKI